MIGQILAALITISPAAPMPNPSLPPLEERQIVCTNYFDFLQAVKLRNEASVFELLIDERVKKVSNVLRQLTTVLDDYLFDPDMYMVLTLVDEPIAMLIPSFQSCVMKPLYINLKFYIDVRGEEKEKE